MPYINVYIHFVWSTKNRAGLLHTEEIRKLVWNHIRENAKSKGIYIDFISGYSDHCHCLISLGVVQTIQKVMQLIKGASSFWINKQKLISSKFEWQDEYFAFAVSKSNIENVRAYIGNQEIHHLKKAFQEEYDELMHNYNAYNLKNE